MQAGLMRKRIQIQQRGTAVDSVGQQVITWTTLTTVYAQVDSLSGSQLQRAQSIYNETTHRVTLRWQTILNDIKSVGSMRILLGTRIFDVGADLNVDERNRTIELLCKEGLNDGQ